MPVYYVSRQHYYYSGQRTVEVARGGLDYAGADMLTPRYPGEGQEYASAVEAVEAAIAIRKLWAEALKLPEDAEAEEVPVIAFGSTMGAGIEIEADEDEDATLARARAEDERAANAVLDGGEDEGFEDWTEYGREGWREDGDLAFLDEAENGETEDEL